MDFGLSDDQGLFQEALRGYLAEHAPADRVRRAMENENAVDRDLLAGLGAQGVPGILIPEAFGGSELTLLDAAIAAEELGRAAVPCSAHSAFVMAPMAIVAGGTDQQQGEWLPRIARGEALVSFVESAPAVVDGCIDGEALFVPDAMTADAFVLACGNGADRRLVLLKRDTPGLVSSLLRSVDQTRPLGELSFNSLRVEQECEMPYADGPALVERIVDAGRVALAADMLGAAERTLADAVEYSLTRKQFGRAVGSFQAVKHMCAEVFAAVEPLRSMMWYAAFAWDERREDAHEVVLLLKAHAADKATEAVTTAVQVFGGMGFTWECDVHLWFKRVGYDRQALGGPDELRAAAASLLL